MTCPKAFAGVTLVESLIVLSLSTSLLLLTVSQVTSWRRQVAYDYFVAEFERSLVYSQQAAILSQRGSRVFSQTHSNIIEFSYYDYQQEQQREVLELPIDLEVVRETVVTFRPGTGNVNRINRFEFYNQHKGERLIFQYYLGSGRFVKREEK